MIIYSSYDFVKKNYSKVFEIDLKTDYFWRLVYNKDQDRFDIYYKLFES